MNPDPQQICFKTVPIRMIWHDLARDGLTPLMRHCGLVMILAAAWTWGALETRGQDTGDTPSPFRIERDVMVPMRDGVSLATSVFLPEAPGSYPVLLMRTPYGKPENPGDDLKRYIRDGFAVVAQDCRGKGNSEGVWDPFVFDPKDGVDTQEWVGIQPWCNGRIGTMGGSYVGWTQWASMPDATPWLTCAVPVVPFTHVYDDIAYYGGSFQVALLFGWGTAVGGVFPPPHKINELFSHLPLETYGSQFDTNIPYLSEWITHNRPDDEYWKSRSIQNRYQDISIPVLNIGGWYDIFSKVTLESVMSVRRESKNLLARRNQFVIMGPWAHGPGARKVGDLDFGPDASLDLDSIQRQWFNFWLKNQDTGIQDWPPVRIFVMGSNQWRSEYEWPLKRTVYTPWYLHSHGQANSTDGNGTLTLTAPKANEPEDTFLYDPNNPVPTTGGNNLVAAPIGPFDQQKLEMRDDILVYTSGILDEAVEVTGPVKAVLFVSSSAPATDFTAKLLDVHPDGKAYNLCDGIKSIQFTEPDSTDSPTRVEIDLWVTSNRFLKDHRIRVEITSSNFPRFARNLNTNAPFGQGVDMMTARQKVFHSLQSESHILLPVIPDQDQE